MRILVVEDEEKVSRFVSRGLTAERFAVDVARDGKSGWEFAETYQYDLIILDLMLPGLAGAEVLNRIRKSKSQVPILILTALRPNVQTLDALNLRGGVGDSAV